MTGSFKREDLRVVKTYKSLSASLLTLLEKRNFNNITVNDLCEEAMISRSAFYAHFTDKYDLLRHYLVSLQEYFVAHVLCAGEEVVVESVNAYFRSHERVIRNINEDANPEVLMLLHSFFVSLIDSIPANGCHDELLLFCAGGMMHLLDWQVKNRFPPDSPPLNPYLYHMLKNILRYGANTS